MFFNGKFFINFKSWIIYSDYDTFKLDEKNNALFNNGSYFNGYSFATKNYRIYLFDLSDQSYKNIKFYGKYNAF